MEEAETLQNEVYRILTAPFQVSLQNLHGLVQRSNPRSLQQWADAKPCQVDALADAVLKGLDMWPYIFDILEQLVKIIAFRDSVLRQNSLLLDKLLTDATKRSDSWQKYSNICVSILSNPLPGDIPIPASFDYFFQSTVETMTPSSSADTIRPVYNLLCGVGPGTFRSLPRETIEKFQKVCRDLLGASVDHDRSINLLCLASLARIARGWNPVHFPSINSSLPPCQPIPYDEDWFQRVLEFFNPKRAGKTLQLILVFVNQACSINIDVPVANSLEILALAKDVVESVEKSELEKWLQVRTGSQMVSKLDRKIEGLEPQPELQAAALSFRMSFYDSKETPSIATRLCWDVVARCIRMERPDCAANLLEHPAIRPDESIMASINQDTMNCILNTSIHIASGIMEKPRKQFSTIPSFTSLIKFLDESVQASTSTRLKLQKILSAIDTFSNWKRLATLMKNERTHACEPKRICGPTLVNMRTNLAISICTLFVRVSPQLLESMTMTSAAVASPLDVLMHLASLSCSSSCKAMVPTRAKPRVSVFELGSTPQTDTPSRDWRDLLANQLHIDSVRSQEAIIRFIGEVFRDYENRCANVEQPLREAMKKHELVQAELQASKATNGELENQVSEAVTTTNTLASEKAKLERIAKGVRTKLEILTEDLRAAQENESAAQEDADRAAKDAENQVKLKELEFLAATTAKDETLELQQRELARLDAELTESKHQLEDANLENWQISEKFKALDQRIQSQETDLDELRKSSAVHREKISALELDNESLASKIEDLNDQLAKANESYEALQSENQNLGEDKNNALESQKELHQQELRKADVEANERLSLKDQQIDGLNAALVKAERDAATELRSKNATISSLELQVEELLARDHAITSFMKQMTRDTETGRTPRRHSHLEHRTVHADSIAPRLAIGGYDGPCDSSSSSNSGPTPKRRRSHRTAGTPSRRVVRFSSVHSSYKPPSRQPLEEASAVNGEKMPIRASDFQRKSAVMKSMEDLGLGDLEDISFTDGSVFTSLQSRKHDSSAEKRVARADDETADEL